MPDLANTTTVADQFEAADAGVTEPATASSAQGHKEQIDRIVEDLQQRPGEGYVFV